MRSPIVKFAIALTTAAVLIIVITAGLQRSDSQVTKEPNYGEPAPYSTPEPKVGPGMEPIAIELPEPVFDGTPQDHKVENLEKPLGRARPPFLAPVGTKNVALGKPVFSTDEEPVIGEIELITDGDKEAADGSFVELGPFHQHVTIDLESMHNIYAVVVWHYHMQPVVYFDVVVQAADDRDFTANVRTLFNNDIDNSIGLGVGKDKHYTETSEGKLIDAKGIKARYIRLHSNGSTRRDELNHYIEVEVYGKPVSDSTGLVPLEIELPRPMFVGTKEDIRVPNLKKPSFRPRPPFLAPAGTKNVALGKPVFSSDEEPIIGEIEMITDGDKEACDGSYVHMNRGVQYVTIDLEAMHKIYAIVVWHYHKSERVYFDVVVQVADDLDLIYNVRTLFNNDHDNSAGLGVGKNLHYVGTNQGNLINAKGVKARYVRLYSNGNNNTEFNHYIEVEVYGKPVNDMAANGNVPLKIDLPKISPVYH
ncbi:MAG: hypothetical protein ACYS8Z_08035 [Planctomycetota bacterium]